MIQKPVAITRRLKVFEFRCEPSELNTLRRVFVAFRKDNDQPTPVCTAVVLPGFGTGELKRPWIDWLETSSLHRRQGYATELLTAIEVLIGACEFEGATEEGDAFCDAYCAGLGEEPV